MFWLVDQTLLNAFQCGLGLIALVQAEWRAADHFQFVVVTLQFFELDMKLFEKTSKGCCMGQCFATLPKKSRA